MRAIGIGVQYESNEDLDIRRISKGCLDDLYVMRSHRPDLRLYHHNTGSGVRFVPKSMHESVR